MILLEEPNASSFMQKLFLFNFMSNKDSFAFFKHRDLFETIYKSTLFEVLAIQVGERHCFLICAVTSSIL
jgi:hypothetical protein